MHRHCWKSWKFFKSIFLVLKRSQYLDKRPSRLEDRWDTYFSCRRNPWGIFQTPGLWSLSWPRCGPLCSPDPVLHPPSASPRALRVSLRQPRKFRRPGQRLFNLSRILRRVKAELGVDFTKCLGLKSRRLNLGSFSRSGMFGEHIGEQKDSSIYSTNLPADILAIYQTKQFELGKVPELPPSLDLCVWWSIPDNDPFRSPNKSYFNVETGPFNFIERPLIFDDPTC